MRRHGAALVGALMSAVVAAPPSAAAQEGAASNASSNAAPSEGDGLLWVPALVTLGAGVVFLGAGLNAQKRVSALNDQRDSAPLCAADPDCTPTPYQELFLSTAGFSGNPCDSSVAEDVGATQSCNAGDRATRQGRVYLALSGISLGASAILLTTYIVRARRRARRAENALRLAPVFARREVGLHLDWAF